MRRSIINEHAQSLSEYVALILLVVFALFAMRTYIQRGIQAVVKNAADQLGDQSKGTRVTDKNNIWPDKGSSELISTSTQYGKTTQGIGGAISYEKEDTTTQTGKVFHSESWEKK